MRRQSKDASDNRLHQKGAKREKIGEIHRPGGDAYGKQTEKNQCHESGKRSGFIAEQAKENRSCQRAQKSQ